MVDSIGENRFKVKLKYLSQINEVNFIITKLLDHPINRLVQIQTHTTRLIECDERKLRFPFRKRDNEAIPVMGIFVCRIVNALWYVKISRSAW